MAFNFKKINPEEEEFLETMEGMFPSYSYEEIIKIIKNMKRINPNEEEFLQSMKALFPNIDYQNITNIIQTIRIILPTQCNSEELIRLESIVNNAKQLIEDSEQYRQQLAEYNTSINALEKQKENSEKKLQELKQSISTLEEQSQRLNESIKEIKIQKEITLAEIEGLKKIIQQYNQSIQQITGYDIQVPTTHYEITWEPIADDDPIYKISCADIHCYIDSLIYRYCEKTQETFTNAHDIFHANNPSLYFYPDITRSPAEIDDEERKNTVFECLKKIRVPHYTIKHEAKTPKYTVIWSPISIQDPIFDIVINQFDDYINSLIETFMIKTGASKNQATLEFQKNFPGFDSIIKLSHHVGYFKPKIREICEKNYSSLDLCYPEYQAKYRIKTILSIAKLPIYVPIQTYQEQPSQEINTPQSQLLTNELYWKEKITLAYTKIALLKAQEQALLDQLNKMKINKENIYEQLSNPELEISSLAETILGSPKANTYTGNHSR